MHMNELLNEVVPIDKVIADARRFLTECGWLLEIEGQVIPLPKDLELRVQTRAYISASAPDVFLGDHFEAVVLLGCNHVGSNWIAEHGYLKLYFDLGGQFVSEDRFKLRASHA